MKIKAWKCPVKGISSPAFALWANAEVYILLPSLTYLLPQFLTDLLTKLVIKKFETFHTRRSKETLERVKTWPFYGLKMGLTWSTKLVIPES